MGSRLRAARIRFPAAQSIREETARRSRHGECVGKSSTVGVLDRADFVTAGIGPPSKRSPRTPASRARLDFFWRASHFPASSAGSAFEASDRPLGAWASTLKSSANTAEIPRGAIGRRSRAGRRPERPFSEPKSGRVRPECAVKGRQPPSRIPVRIDRELLAEGELDHGLARSIAKERRDRRNDDSKDSEK